VLPSGPVSSYLTFSPLPPKPWRRLAFARLSTGGYFLLHYYTLADIFLLGNMVLCVARTFLSDLRLRSGRIDGTTCCPAKVINYLRSEGRLLLMIIFVCKKIGAGCMVFFFTMHHAPCNCFENDRYSHQRL